MDVVTMLMYEKGELHDKHMRLLADLIALVEKWRSTKWEISDTESCADELEALIAESEGGIW